MPYCLRVSEEVHIYRKLLNNSSLSGSPCAPGTLEMMAQFSVLTRLKEPENSSFYSKLRVYDGESLKDVDPKAKTLQEYRDYAGPDEGMETVRAVRTRVAAGDARLGRTLAEALAEWFPQHATSMDAILALYMTEIGYQPE